MSFTVNEVLDLFNNSFDWEYLSWSTKKWEPLYDEDDKYGDGGILQDGWLEISRKRITVDGETYEVEVLEEGGGMDEGSSAYIIFKFGDQYFSKSGYYQSHYGYDWDGDFIEVEPYEMTVTDYRPV